MNSVHSDRNQIKRRNYAAKYNFIHSNENILCLGQNDIDKYESNVHAQCNYVATF